MPSNPTTLAELVSALEAESRAALQRAITYRTYGTSNSASDYEAFKADLMERAAKVLRAVLYLTRWMRAEFASHDGDDHESAA